MACTTRVELSASTKRRVWADSGGYCANQGHRARLFVDDSDVDFGELAHIIAASTGGPRDVPVDEVDLASRASHGNVVLLCANCHTVIDKDPDSFPAEMLRQWKAYHLSRLTEALGTPRFDNRASARAHIEPMLAKNRAVHEQYAPTAEDPYAPHADMWRRQVLSVVIPTNSDLHRIFETNHHLLTPAEVGMVATFDLHRRQLEDRHVLGDWTEGSIRFPPAVAHVFADPDGRLAR